MIVCIFVKLITKMLNQSKKFLQDYASLSGQEVNYQKSSLFFDKLVPNSQEVSTVSISGIHNKGARDLSRITLPYWKVKK